MKLIKQLNLSFSQLLNLKKEIQKIEIENVYFYNFDFTENKEPLEAIQIYNELIKDFKNIKNLESYLKSLNFVNRLFEKVFKMFADNFEKYSPEYIKKVISSDSSYSSDFLVYLMNKHKQSNLQDRLALHQKIKKDFNEYYNNFFDEDNYLLIEYVLLLNSEDPEIEEFFFQQEDLNNICVYYSNIKKTRSDKLEKKLLQSVIKDGSVYINVFSLCCKYCDDIINGPWLEFEDILSKNDIINFYIFDSLAEYINKYKRKLDNLNDRIFDSFDNEIVKDYKFADKSTYYRHLFDGYLFRIYNFLNPKIINRMEQKILELKEDLYFNFYYYSKNVLKTRWKEHEDKFLDPSIYMLNGKSLKKYRIEFLIDYIKSFKIKNLKLNPQIFDFIKTNYKLAYNYAYAIKERVPELEPAIAKSFTSAFNYATKILKDRFPLGEKKILKSRKAEAYRTKFNL
jgi:hypothetical protein